MSEPAESAKTPSPARTSRVRRLVRTFWLYAARGAGYAAGTGLISALIWWWTNW